MFFEIDSQALERCLVRTALKVIKVLDFSRAYVSPEDYAAGRYGRLFLFKVYGMIRNQYNQYVQRINIFRFVAENITNNFQSKAGYFFDRSFHYSDQSSQTS